MLTMVKSHYTLAELAAHLGAELQGDGNCTISSIATINKAVAGQITFLDNIRYRKYLPSTQASAVILARANLSDCPTNALILKNPYLGYAKVADLFKQIPGAEQGIHPSAVIDVNCKIHPTASIGPQCVIGREVTIGENVILGAGTVIGDRCTIGAGSRFWPRVTLYYDVCIGERAIIHSGAVIGSDGFGFAQDNGSWRKITQLGSVVIGNDVEIGANTTIDRGAIDDTIIENGVKIDNQVQIAHNVTIGTNTAIAGCVGIAGTTTIGKHCAIGGGVGISGHVNITDGVIIVGGALVAQSIKEPGVYSSGLPAQPAMTWKKIMFRVLQLDTMAQKVRALEKIVTKQVTKEEESV